MTDPSNLIRVVLIVVAIIGLIAGIAYYLLITTEGVYLGQGAVTWLYDLYARRYNGIKNFTPEYEQLFIAYPLLMTVADREHPLILDIATGTGRVPLALCAAPDSGGVIIGLDHSTRMLQEAATALNESLEDSLNDACIILIRGDALRLPFEADTFDAVTCLEALEFTANPRAALREMVRVLRPDGTLFITRRRGLGAWLMPRRAMRRQQLLNYLERDLGLDSAQVRAWQVDYEQVWAFKS